MPEKPPNIIVFVLDSLRPDHLGCNGCEIAKTPNIDQLAEHGITCTNAYSEYPITIPTRTALMAGIYTHTSRCWKPMTPYDLHIPNLFKKRGYKTALFGDSPMSNPVFNCHIGFETHEHSQFGKVNPPLSGVDLKSIQLEDYYWIKDEPKVDKDWGENTLKIEQNIFVTTLANELLLKEREGVRRAEKVTNWALNWLENFKNNANPFFLWIDHFEPHEPWLAPENYLKPFRHLMDDSVGHCPMPPADAALLPKSVIKNLLAHVHATNYEVDTEIGKVVQKVDDLGLTEKTIFVILSDHGEPYGEHGTIRKYGTPIYDELAKIPFIIKGPGFEPGRKMNLLITTPDISGFLLETAGIKRQKEMESISLYPAIKNEESEIDAIHDMIFMGAFQLRAGCRTPRWKFIDNRGEKGRLDELYDMIEDPMETNNLIAQESDIADALAKDVWEFGSQWSRQLAFRDHPLTSWAQIKINTIMGKNFQRITKERGY